MYMCIQIHVCPYMYMYNMHVHVSRYMSAHTYMYMYMCICSEVGMFMVHPAWLASYV